MGWVRVLRSDPSRGMKQSWEGSCQSRKEGRKCRTKGACECWERLIILWEHPLNAEWAHSAPLFLFPGAFPSLVRSRPYASSQSPALSQQFPGLCCQNVSHSFICPKFPGSSNWQVGEGGGSAWLKRKVWEKK